MTAIYGITQSPPPATNPVATPTTMAGEADRGDWGRSIARGWDFD